MENKYFYICDKNSYRFYERISEGLLKVPNLKIVRLTCSGVETDSESIELCSIELKMLIPIFQLYLELKEKEQSVRIEQMREFIGGKINRNYFNSLQT